MDNNDNTINNIQNENQDTITGPQNFDSSTYNGPQIDPNYKAPRYSAPRPKKPESSNLGKWAFALSLIGCTSIIGAILAIVDLSKKDGKKKDYAIGALCVCGVYLVIFMVGRNKRNRHTDSYETAVSTEAPADDTSSSETTELVSNDEVNQVSSESNTASTEASTESSGVSSDFKEMMDAYEAFIDEYIEFMELYNQNPSDTELMTQYLDYMTKYNEYMTTISNLKNDDMTDEELAYYLEVTNRCSQKLIQAGMSY